MSTYYRATQAESYLSASGGVVAGKWTGGGGGVVKCVHSCGTNEKFWPHWPHKIPGAKGDVEVGIELVAYPGRFLSLDANLGTLNLQGVKSYLSIQGSLFLFSQRDLTVRIFQSWLQFCGVLMYAFFFDFVC